MALPDSCGILLEQILAEKGGLEMRKTTSSFLALTFFAAASSAMAEDAVDPKKVPITPSFEAQSAAECPEGIQSCKLVCKTFAPPTGTLLGGHRECRTQHWWDDRMREDQATIVKIQEEAYHYGPH